MDPDGDDTYEFEAEVYIWAGEKAAWHFLTLPDEISDEIEARADGATGGFGSVRVRATIGETEWTTSLFPSNEKEAYILPLKASVREAENITEGDTVTLTLVPLI